MTDVDDPVETYPGDPRLRMRLFVGRVLAAQWWGDASSPDIGEQVRRVRAEHLALAQAATRAGQLWMIEVYDPGDPTVAGVVRFGTDTTWYPHVLTLSQVSALLDAVRHVKGSG